MASLEAATVVITGGGGFLGQRLATQLAKDRNAALVVNGQTIKVGQLILSDVAFADERPAADELNVDWIVQSKGDVSDAAYVDQLYSMAMDSKPSHVAIFHLGAIMSGDGERDFDLCMRVNLHGCLHMLEGARKHLYQAANMTPTFVFCSAGATIGAGAPTDFIQKSDIISDATRATPHTTYGATKACGELLVADYTRRGFVHGRGVRLPTIGIRAGRPNAATTSCFSSVVREPLAGVSVCLPIAADVPHAMTSVRHAIDAMIKLHNASSAQVDQLLGYDRTVFLPATALSLDDLTEALYKIVTPQTRHKLGKITHEVDQQLSHVVGSFPTKINANRALLLGLPAAPDAETLVRDYVADFPAAIAPGIELVPKCHTTSTACRASEPVAVITGAGSGIGQAVARRLAQAGWIVVLTGRRIQTLQETQKLLDGPATPDATICVVTDVTSEPDVENLFTMVEAKYGRLDLLFNNAGVNSAAQSFEQVTLADFERVLQTNVRGPFLCARAAMKIMAHQGGGRIINNGSLSAHVPRPGSACYTVSKHAVWGMTKSIALDGRALNVACGQIDFGNVVSAMSRATNSAAGALQPNGEHVVEPSMTLEDAAETVWAMANLPLEANVLQMTVMATQMPFVGRG